MLGVLCATFLLTGVIVQKTFTPAINLTQTAAILQKNLHAKEQYVNDLITDTASFNLIKHLHQRHNDALSFIDRVTVKKRVWVYTYYNNNLAFWTGAKFNPPRPGVYKEGRQFIKLPNGHFEVIRKSQGNFSALFIIPVKLLYPYENRFLINAFDKDMLEDDNVDIADFTDKPVTGVRSVDNQYLFSLKLKPGTVNHRFYYLELTMWLLGFLTFCILVHNICNYVLRKGRPIAAIGLLLGFILLVRLVNLYWGLPAIGSDAELFSPSLYHAGKLFPNLGDFCINILFVTWLAAFIYHHRNKLLKTPLTGNVAYATMIVASAFMIALAGTMLYLFYGLVLHSNISFDVSNVFNLSVYSFLGVLMLCFTFLLYYFFSDSFLLITKRLEIPEKVKLGIMLAFIACGTISMALVHNVSVFFVLVGLFAGIRLMPVWYGNGKLTPPAFIALIATCAFIAATSLSNFQEEKEHKIRQALALQLEASDDKNADTEYNRVEELIVRDEYVLRYFNDTARNTEYLKTRFQTLYFDNYLSKYDFTVHTFDAAGKAITADNPYGLEVYKELVETSSFKVSRYFYRENDAFGFQSYFAILPVIKNGNILGTIVVTLKSKPLTRGVSFPELLARGELRSNYGFQNYAYAFYNDGQLANQSGRYVYTLSNYMFKGQLRKFIFTQTTIPNPHWYTPFAKYSHLVYQPSQRYLIVVSHEEDILAQSVTSLTFFFVTLLAFSMCVIFVNWAWTRIRIFNIRNERLRVGFRVNVDKILYRSRIQFSVIFTVVITLLIVGIITFQTISLQYREQQSDTIRDKILRIADVFQNGVQRGLYGTTDAGKVRFNEFANTYAADLTLFDVKGNMLLTTQPKIYDNNILTRRMNGRAYIHMRRLQKSEFLTEETLGNLKYQAAYVPIKGDGGGTIAFLHLPYFGNQSDYNQRIGSLLNAMINIYALVFVAIGLVAVIIARQITSPLNFIQQSLSNTIYGKKNEPIVWDRDDEIGALVKEYNKMIAELERSAQRLAQSERETAWREMAKQVAHEIKNPLTPLKLGLQLLDKAWKDKDPKFDQKFERFSKSFVEQIESLSSIASEFSAFAKMPETKLERVDVFNLINQAVIIFKQMDNVTIDYNPGPPFFIKADRDQLLRCFNNLLKNAIEAIPDSRAGQITVTYNLNAGNVLIVIADNGNGIPEHVRERIFEPNFTTKSSGTGLGLAFVKNSIENAGGRIWYETEMGVGTTFYLSLNAAETA